ncbi:glutamate--tRNA ligase [bacterium]|nr:glutamate--tRNA ligase [bacterium]
MTVVTRFAPSPTGFLHIGGARTALFCWLFAKARGGKFLLRIEDTDRERSTQAAVEAIFDGLSWLGLDPDEPPVFQSERAARHREVALELVSRGAAYRCDVTPEDLDARRQAVAALKREGDLSAGLTDENRAALTAARDLMLRPFRSSWRDKGEGAPANQPHVVRLRMPDRGDIKVEDAVQGEVRVAAQELDDLVLLRSDGSPTYMLSVVVDDHDMGVTHVIRGDDHLTNTFRQLPIHLAMGWSPPVYAHVPMIHGPDGKKLSKRHGALGVDAYRDLGYLPEALRNYLLRLGWSHGDAEIISEVQAIEWFDLDGLNKSPARLDLEKLGSINARYLAAIDDDRLFTLLLARDEMKDVSASVRERIRLAAPLMKQRARTLVDLCNQLHFLTDIRPVRLEGKAAAALSEEARGLLSGLNAALAAHEDWSEASIKNVLNEFVASAGVGLGKIGPALRAVLTGGTSAPDLATVLSLLGRDETLARLGDQLGRADNRSNGR